MPDPVVIATWPFGKPAAETALKSLTSGDPALDAALAGAQAVEDDSPSAPRSASAACRTASAGSPSTPASWTARRSPAGRRRRRAHQAPRGRSPAGDGEDAARPARRRGGEVVRACSRASRWKCPTPPRAIKEWLDRHPDRRRPRQSQGATLRQRPVRHQRRRAQPRHGDGAGPRPEGEPRRRLHDVRAWRTSCPGRVGDSPLIGAGLYVDDQAGAAGGDRRRRGDHPHRRQPVHRRADAGRQVAAGGVRAGLQAGERRGRAAAASTRPRSRSWRWTRRGTSARPAPPRPTSSTPSAAATRSRWSRRRRSGRKCSSPRPFGERPGVSGPSLEVPKTRPAHARPFADYHCGNRDQCGTTAPYIAVLATSKPGCGPGLPGTIFDTTADGVVLRERRGGSVSVAKAGVVAVPPMT